MSQQIDFIYNIHEKMRNNNVLLAFTGEFDMKIINALITSVKLKLQEVENIPRIRKRVYGLMVECLETIFRSYHRIGEDAKNIDFFSIFTLSRDTDYYYLIAGNYVLNEKIEFQQAQIDKINKMSTAQKKEHYRQCITGDFTEEHSSNLAIVDMAIKSNNLLSYEFKEVDDQMSFYIFQVKLKIN